MWYVTHDNYSPCCLMIAQPFPGYHYLWLSKERLGKMNNRHCQTSQTLPYQIYTWGFLHRIMSFGQMWCLAHDNYSPCCLVTAQPFPGSRYRWPSKERIGLMDHSNWCWEALRHIGDLLTSWKGKAIVHIVNWSRIFSNFLKICCMDD